MVQWFSEFKIGRNYKETPAKNVMRSTMQVGPEKVRRSTTANVRKVTFSMMLTKEVLQSFDEFYKSNDASVFDFVNPRTGATERARFADVPQYSLNETMWDVAVELELLP